MDGSGQLRTSAVGWIVNRIVAKGNISDSRVKEIFRKRRVFERLGVNAGIRVEFGGDSSRNGIKFYASAPRADMQRFGHQTEEVTNTHRRFENVYARLESKLLHRLPDRLHDFGRCVVRVWRGGASRRQLLRGK